MYIRRFISVLAAALSIGVCVFITYISRDVDQGTILFNLVFLGVMLVAVAAAYLAGLRRLMQDCRGLTHAAELIQNETDPSVLRKDTTELFGNEFLDDCYRQYNRMLQDNPTAACDISGFISEETIENHAHRGILETVPDILTSLGILGTFIGLVMGLRSFNPSGYEQMAGSITPLINGIKVAFITSIYGISLSLAFSFNLRSEFSNLSDCMEKFLDAFYLRVRPPYEVDSLSRLLEGQKSRDEMTKDLTTVFVEQMGRSFEQVITPAYERMTEGIHQVVESFTQSQTQVMEQVCEAMIQQMRSELNNDFDRLSSTIQDLQQAQNSYVDFMDRSMVRMQQTFSQLQDNMSQMTQYTTQALDQLNTSQKAAHNTNQEQKEAYQEYIRFMYETINQFSDVWEKNSAVLQGYSDEISKMGPVQSNAEIRKDISQLGDLLLDVRKRLTRIENTQDLSEYDQDVTRMLEKTLRKLDSLEDAVSAPSFSLFRPRRKK